LTSEFGLFREKLEEFGMLRLNGYASLIFGIILVTITTSQVYASQLSYGRHQYASGRRAYSVRTCSIVVPELIQSNRVFKEQLIKKGYTPIINPSLNKYLTGEYAPYPKAPNKVRAIENRGFGRFFENPAIHSIKAWAGLLILSGESKFKVEGAQGILTLGVVGRPNTKLFVSKKIAQYPVSSVKQIFSVQSLPDCRN
jgi:hypothetical protein